MTTHILLHSRLDRSLANGPGVRSVVWVQGCTLRCKGCFNPATHPTSDHAESADVDDLAQWVTGNDVTGLTISGGEPFEQHGPVIALARQVRMTGLSVIMLTGLTLAELERIAPLESLRDAFDVIITGRYQQQNHLGAGLRGSTNKQIHLLSSRHTLTEFDDIPQSEILIGAGGDIVVTGVNVPYLSGGR